MEANLTVETLRASAVHIARRVTDATFAEEPFWTARFGDRGRQRTYEDAAYHIDYLVQALAAQDPDVMRGYARWLQSLLTTRGMCTAHIAENFERIEAILSGELAEPAVALDYLRRAREALLYPAGPARELQEASPELARVAAQRMNGILEERDMRHLLSYLADAIALGRPELFDQYLRFASSFFDKRGARPGAMRRAVDVLADALRERPTSSTLAAEVSAMMTVAISALSSPPPPLPSPSHQSS